MPTNRNHPADRLAELRAQIKALELEEQELRDWLLDHPDDREGFDAVAIVSERTVRKLDQQALRRFVSAEIVSKCTRSVETVYVHVRALEKV
jgi:hypothetical protein